MHLKIKKEDLLPALERASRVSEHDNTLPALSHVLIEAGETICLSATNQEIGVRQRIAGEILEPGAALLRTAILYEIVKAAEEAFKGADFLKAPDLEEMAADLIEQKGLGRLDGLKIVYLWKKLGGSRGGRAVLGKCQKPRGLLEHFCSADMVIWLAADHALKLNFTRFQVEAALFHELSHIRLDPETDEPLVVPHDFEGFIRELETYGTWTEDLFRLKASMEQMKLL